MSFVAFGHGDAAVHEGACGERGLLDAGSGSADEVLAALDAAGGRSLAWAAVSHYDADHVGDVAEVATAPGASVGVVYDRGGDRTVKDTDAYREYHDWFAAPGAPARTAVDIGDRWALCAGTAEEVTFSE